MTYSQVQQLATDPTFNERISSCMWSESQHYKDDPDPATTYVAEAILRGAGSTIVASMVNMVASFPGLVDGATITLGDGSQLVDQTAVGDEDILAQVQANWKTVADLFYPAPVTPPS